jgi:hypothetical protein
MYFSLDWYTNCLLPAANSHNIVCTAESRQESLPGSGWMQTWNKNGESEDCASLDVAKSIMRPWVDTSRDTQAK